MRGRAKRRDRTPATSAPPRQPRTTHGADNSDGQTTANTHGADNPDGKGKGKGRGRGRAGGADGRDWEGGGHKHVHFTLHKENKDTMEAVSVLARMLQCASD